MNEIFNNLTDEAWTAFFTGKLKMSGQVNDGEHAEVDIAYDSITLDLSSKVLTISSDGVPLFRGPTGVTDDGILTIQGMKGTIRVIITRG